MMGLHQNYQVTWGAERMEGLTLDLGLDGMFSPLPMESNPSVVTKDFDPPSSWRGFLDPSQTEQHIIADIDLDDDDSDDPCALLLNNSNCVGGTERKQDMFGLSLTYPPPLARQQQRQQLINTKVDLEDVEPSLTMVMPTVRGVASTSQSEGSFNCWRNTTLERSHKEVHLYGAGGDESRVVEFLDDDTMDDTMDDCHEIKPDRFVSSSVLPVAAVVQQQPQPRMYPETIILDDDLPEIIHERRPSNRRVDPAAVQQQKQPLKMHPETIILDDDTDDDEIIFVERCTADKEESFSQSPFGDDRSRRGSEEREGVSAVSQVMPLRQIKQHVRSSRNDEDYNSCVTRSASPEITTREQDNEAKELDICEKKHYHWAEEQVNSPKSPNPKRVRGHGYHDWLPSDLLDASHLERKNEAKRVRGNGSAEHNNDIPQIVHRIPTDVPIPVPVPPSPESSVQMQKHNPLIDVNQAIQAMPQETAEAFKELIRLVGPFEARASRAVDEMKNSRPLTNDIQHNGPPSPPPSPPVTTTGSKQSSRAIDEMESRRSFASVHDEHTCNTPLPPVTENQASRILNEMENWRPLASDVQDDPLQSQRSVTTSDFEQSGSPTLSSDFGLSDSPPLATVDEPLFRQGGAPSCVPSESTFSECSPPIDAIYEQQNAGKRTSHADVVLYQPKQEPVESQSERNVSASVVRVKEEQDLYYEPTPDPVSVRPVQQNGLVRPCYSTRKLIRTALDTFEAVRQQIIKDPSYGQPVVEPQTPGTEVNHRRLRADLKAASLMRSKGFWLNEQIRPIGHVPGVAVGDCFRYRIEMAVIGLHRAVQAGIAIVPAKLSTHGVAVAASVVLGVCDPYRDDRDMGDKVIYSGQGGLCGRTKESQDQKLTRGNLALYNSLKRRLPVRLIRGHKEQDSMTGNLYSYDGLYQVHEMKYETGVSGKKVYTFYLERLPGQPPLFSGYPTPLGSQPPAREPTQDEVLWTEPSDTKPLYLEKRPES